MSAVPSLIDVMNSAAGALTAPLALIPLVPPLVRAPAAAPLTVASAPPQPAAPNSYRCHLNIRVGLERTTRRSVNELQVRDCWDFVLADGYNVLRAQVQTRLSGFNGYSWPTEANLLLAPSLNTTQPNLVILTEDNLTDQFTSAYRRASTRRTSAAEGFRIELWVYLVSAQGGGAASSSNGVRRATQANLAAATLRINESLRLPENRTLANSIGSISRRHWATTEARRPPPAADAPPPAPPTTNTFRQTLWLDQQAAIVRQRQTDNATLNQQELREIRIEMNGVLVPVRMSIVDLRAALGLPPMDLTNVVNFATAIPSNPLDDMEDVDHQDDD